MDIQWYPGHMTKSKRMIVDNISIVDIIIELLDARAPYSSKNPDIDALAKNKKRIIVLNKADLANDTINRKWADFFSGSNAVLLNSLNGNNLPQIEQCARSIMHEKIEREKKRGRAFVPIRAMVVGIPNVGKSTFINRFVGSKTAKTADRPGVTRGKQWIKIKKDFDLLDTPGILWPKFEEPEVGVKLSIIGAIKDQIVDIIELACELINILKVIDFNLLLNRYNIDVSFSDDVLFILKSIGEARGFILKGGEINLERTSQILIDEFRGGKLGRISLETP